MGIKVGNSSIRLIGKGNFRAKVFAEDVMYPSKVIHIQGKYEEQEEIKVYDDIPFHVTDVGVYFRAKLTGASDSRLREVVNKLYYINGILDKQGEKKMVEFILQLLTEPGTSYEQMANAVGILSNHVSYTDIIPLPRITFFSRFSTLSSREKSTITLNIGRAKLVKQYTELIHQMTALVIEVEHCHMQIGSKAIIEEITTAGESLDEADKIVVKSRTSINKYMKDETKDMIRTENEGRYFKRRDILEKYLEFCKNPIGTLDELAARYGSSKSTMIKFRKLYKVEMDSKEADMNNF